VLTGTLSPLIWIISVSIGLLQAFVFAEMAGLFPRKPGGHSLSGSRRWLALSTGAGRRRVLGGAPARVIRVAKVWVLDTETKGTGAQMVPLEKVLRQPASEPEHRRARPLPKPRRKREAPEPVPPRRFHVIDALSREVLADDANAPETLELLRGIAQPVDVSIYVWEEKPQQWRLLTNRERKLLWGFRDRRLKDGSGNLPPRA
jgi:hypothetical protein